jgi:RNA polymerase sigma-70 factor (ECF subfamily)
MSASQSGDRVLRDLVVRAQQGDHDAFAHLAAVSLGRLNAIARLILSDYASADDAVQDALVDAWRDLRSLRDPDRFDAWLNRLLVRACQDSRRRERRRRDAEVALLPSHEPSSPDAQASVAFADELERGLRRLPVDQRSALVLSYFLDLSLADAAATLGIPIGTMKSRLNRALAALRAAMEADERLTSHRAERLA